MGRHYRYFVFRKMRSEDHFVFFLVYEVTTLKVTILAGRARDHFAEQFPVLEPTNYEGPLWSKSYELFLLKQN